MSESQNRNQETLATLSERIKSMLIDSLIIDAIFLGAFIFPIIFQILNIFYPISITKNLVIIIWCLSAFLGLICSTIYFIFMPLNKKGQSVGMRVMKIRIFVIVDRTKTEYRLLEKTDLLLMTKRAFISYIDLLPLGLVGMILINQNINNQSLADRITGTLVLYSEQENK